MTNIEKKPIGQYHADTDILIRTFESVAEASETLKIFRIAACCNGRRETAGGFKWRYLNSTTATDN